MTKRIWSKRDSVAKGLHWQHERDCLDETAEQWISLFKKDEPTVEFVFSDKRPKMKDK